MRELQPVQCQHDTPARHESLLLFKPAFLIPFHFQPSNDLLFLADLRKPCLARGLTHLTICSTELKVGLLTFSFRYGTVFIQF